MAWIAVEDKPPEDWGFVWVKRENDQIALTYYWYFGPRARWQVPDTVGDDGFEEYYDDVTHWQALVAPDA